MSSNTDTTSKRRIAVDQLGGPKATQMYFDTVREEPVVLRQKEGWGSIGKRDYMDRTWMVQTPRCYVSDAGCELETITQRTKLNRTDGDRYRSLPDATVDQIIETAVDKNREWMAVESPHIPYDGDGGINVYADGERLGHKRVEAASEIVVKDGWPDHDLAVSVRYAVDDKHLEAEIDGETVAYSLVNNVESILEGVVYEPDDGEGPTVELRVDSECEDHHETDYEIDQAADTGGADQ